MTGLKELNTTLNTEDFIDICYEKTRYNALRDTILEDLKGEINTLILYQVSSIKKEIIDDKTARCTNKM